MGQRHRSSLKGCTWPWDPIFCLWLVCATGRAIHQCWIWNQGFIQPGQSNCCDTWFKAAPSSGGWVLVANTILFVGASFYLETQWLHPADRNLAAAPSSSTVMTQMRSIYPIYAVSWLRNAVPEFLGVFGLSLVSFSIFMNVPAPGVILQCKNQKGIPTR